MNALDVDDDRIQAAFRDSEAQGRFWQQHYDEISQQYSEQFVAVLNGTVVASAPDLQQLLYTLPGKGIDPLRAWVCFVTPHPQELIL